MEEEATVNSELVSVVLEEVDIDKLLVLVEARPEIYDFRRKDHHNQDKIARAWQLISYSMNVPSSTCKNKWHTLRSSFARYLCDLKKIPSGSGARAKRKWTYADAMSFLIPFMGPQKKTTSNMTRKSVTGAMNESLQNEDRSLEENDEFFVQDENVADVTAAETGSISSTAVDDTALEEMNPKKRKSKTAAEVVAEPMAAYFKSITNKKPTEDHPMLMYWKSLMPDILKLSDISQRRFKTDIMQTLNYYLDIEQVGSNPSPCPGPSSANSNQSFSSNQSGSSNQSAVPVVHPELQGQSFQQLGGYFNN